MRFTPRAAAATAILAAAGALAACQAPADEATSSPAVTITSTATPEPVLASPAEAAPFTEPGTELSAGDTLVIPALAADAEGTETEITLEVEVQEVTTATVEDISDVLSDTDQRGLWNYHPTLVTYVATVSGPTVPTGFTVAEAPSMTGVTTTGGEATAPPATGAPGICPALDVEALTTTGSATGCWVLMAKNDSELASLQYRGSFHGSAANYLSNPVTWAVG